MVKKENNPRAANFSLLEKASNKRLGAGRFALLALKGNPKPPMKKVKVPVPLPSRTNLLYGIVGDDRSKISDITPSVGEESLLNRPALVKEVHFTTADDTDAESSVLDMSMNSGINSTNFTLTKAFVPKAGGAVTTKTTTVGPKRSPFPNVGTSVKTSIQPSNLVYQTHPSNKTISASLSHPKGANIKKSMEINKGLRFTAPSPMTLNRFEVQMGQERSAPESKEYMQIQAEKRREQLQQLEKAHMKEAHKAVKRELRQEFQREQGEGFEAQLTEFDTNADTETFKKKSLVKKILGRLRPNSPLKKRKQQQEENGTISQEQASAMARQALLASKQKMGSQISQPLHHPSSPEVKELFVVSAVENEAAKAVANTEMSVYEGSVPFPVNEILMQHKQDSISDLDASIRKVPVTEILTQEQTRDDESVSTLGTPRVFEKLDHLMRDTHPDPPQITAVESLPGPPMVTSHDANPLIDQYESGDKSAETEVFERAVACSALHCFSEQSKPSKKNNEKIGESIKQTIKASIGENGLESVEASLEGDVNSNKDILIGEKPMFDEIQVSSVPPTDKSHIGGSKASNMSPRSALSLAIDNAIKTAEGKPHSLDDAPTPEFPIQKALSPIVEGDEVPSAGPSPQSAHSSRLKGEEGDDAVIDLTKMADLQRKNHGDLSVDFKPGVLKTVSPETSDKYKAFEPVNFDNLMEIAASRLDKTEGAYDDRYAVEHEQHGDAEKPVVVQATQASTGSPRRVVMGKLVKDTDRDSAPIVQGVEVATAKSVNEPTPKTRGGVKQHFFGLSDSDSGSNGHLEVYEDPDGDIVVCSDDLNNLPKSPRMVDHEMAEPAEGFSGQFSDGLFDLIPSGGSNAKEEMLEQTTNEKEYSFNDRKSDIRHRSPKGNQQTKTQKSPTKHKSRLEDDTSAAYEPPTKDKTIVLDDQTGTEGPTPTEQLKEKIGWKEPEKRSDFLECVFEYSDYVVCGRKERKLKRDDEQAAALPKEEARGVLKEFSKVESSHHSVDIKKSNRQETKLNSTRAKQNESNRQKEFRTRISEQDAREGRILLDHDDAYWDTLSTIASTTKDQSSESEKYMYETAIPGPIPVEITMENKDIEVQSNSNRQKDSFKKATANKSEDMKEKNNSKATKARHVSKKEKQSGTLGGAGAIEGPPSNDNTETGSKSSRVADLINVFEGSAASETISTKETPEGGAKSLAENSRLFLAVTRTESVGACNPIDLTHVNDTGISNTKRISEEAHSEKNNKSSPESQERCQTEAVTSVSCPSLNEESQQQKHAQKPCPETLMERSKKSKNSAKSSRSVSWGVEEIYEAPKQNEEEKSKERQTPREGILDKDFEPEFDNRAVLSAIAAAAAGSAVSRNFSKQDNYNNRDSGNPPTLTEEEENNLLSRTLELSKGLLKSVNVQDLKGPDEEFLRSLFSFGNGDDTTGSSDEDLNLKKEESKKEESPGVFDLFRNIPFSKSLGEISSQSQSVKNKAKASGATHHSPIEVDDLINRYDNVSENLLEQNKLLQSEGTNPGDQENRSDVGNYTSSSRSNHSPVFRSKLEMLRTQRAEALARFQLSSSSAEAAGQTYASAHRSIHTGTLNNSQGRDRDRLKYYTNSFDRSASAGRSSMIGRRSEIGSQRYHSIRSQRPNSTGRLYVDRYPEERDIDLTSTTSDSNTSTPSRKARELRRQLNEALQASQEIRMSQEQLGSELRSFKHRYYRKNDEIEDYALRAIGGQ